MKTVFCPVIEDQVNGDLCLEICLVADREASSRILPQEVEWNIEKCKKCLECKYHGIIE